MMVFALMLGVPGYSWVTPYAWWMDAIQIAGYVLLSLSFDGGRE